MTPASSSASVTVTVDDTKAEVVTVSLVETSATGLSEVPGTVTFIPGPATQVVVVSASETHNRKNVNRSVAESLMGAAYGSAGERCMAISVLLCVDSVADALIDRIRERIPAIKVGPASDPANEMGPLISAEHRDRVAGYIAGAAAEGAKVVVDGRNGVPADGYFVNPTVIDNVAPGMACYDDEIFGPVLSVVRVPGYEEGLAMINDNQYGNGCETNRDTDLSHCGACGKGCAVGEICSGGSPKIGP